jgi:signal peptidase II
VVNRRNLIFFVVCVLGILADQVTKWWVVQNIALGTGEIVVIDGFLSIVHAQNPGAAFGMLRGFEYRHLVFLAFTLVAVGVILDLFRKLPRDDWFMSTTLGLILSGAIGNAIDRARMRYVTDFIRVYTDQPDLKQWLIETVGTYEWPSFNIADANLVVGVLFFMVYQFFFDNSGEVADQALDDNEADGPTQPTEPA